MRRLLSTSLAAGLLMMAAAPAHADKTKPAPAPSKKAKATATPAPMKTKAEAAPKASPTPAPSQSAPAKPRAANSASAVADAVIARVNGRPLLLSNLKEMALDLDVPVAALRSEGIQGDGFRRAITALVDEELLVQAAQKEEIKADDLASAREVEGMIARLVKSLGGEEQFNDFLKSSHMTLDSLRGALLRRETRSSLSAQVVGKRVTVAADEVVRYDKAKHDKGESSEEMNLAQILIRCPREMQGTQEGKARFDRAQEAAREAAQSPEQFGMIASKRSDDPAASETGGHLGWVDPAGLQAPLRDRAARMKPREVSEPVATDLGYHVLLLIAKRTPRDLLFAEKFDAERVKLIESLRKEASIEIYPADTDGDSK